LFLSILKVLKNMSMANPEMLQIADAVAREKGISKSSIIEAMEHAIQVAGRRKYGHKHNIKAEIDKKTGEVRLFRMYEIVEEVEDVVTQISLEDALAKDPNAQLGEFILELLPPIDLGRVAAQAAKQVIVQKVRDAERERQYNEFKPRIGEILTGTVKRVEYGNVIVDFGRDEAILTKEDLIPGDMFRQNDRIRVYLRDVQNVPKGPQIFLSRSCDEFLGALFKQEVPEIYDNVIQIKSVARDPGSKAKLAVYTTDASIDPIGSCVGVRGSRVQAVSNELHGEKIDIILWSSDPATFVINALTPAEASKVIIDEDSKKIEVVVPNDQLSLAIGRKGQNVRLASKLVGWGIDVMTEEEESRRRTDEFNYSTKLFMEALDVEEVIAQLLAAEGYNKVEDIAFSSPEDLKHIEGFDDDIVAELKTRAENYVNNKEEILTTKLKNMEVDPKLIEALGLELDKVVRLADKNIKTLKDLARLSKQEFDKIVPQSGISQKKYEKIISSTKKPKA